MRISLKSDSQQEKFIKVPNFLQTDALVQIFGKTTQLMLAHAPIFEVNWTYGMLQKRI